MTDRDKVKRIINNGDCRGIDCNDCPLSKSNPEPHGVDQSLEFAKQWLKDHPEKYIYAEVDLPEWWDGRPIKGYFWNSDSSKKIGWCIGGELKNSDSENFIVMTERWTYGGWYKYFEPIPSSKTSAKILITKDGETKEIELTNEQMEGLW